MSLNIPIDVKIGIDAENHDKRITTLPSVWSKINGLTPPLSDEVRQLLLHEKVVQSAFVEPQLEAIISDAQEKFLQGAKAGIGFRAIMVSRVGKIHLTVSPNSSYDVPDMQTVLNKGTELPEGDVLVSRQMVREDEIKALSHHRVFQYLVNCVNIILNTSDPELKSKLTPAVLVYDLEQLTQVDGYRHVLRNPEESNKAIIALYPISIDPAK